MILGITGHIATGKTSVAIFISKNYKFAYISADIISHKLLERTDIKEKIISEFTKVILTNNKINRKILGKIVFSDKTKLKILENILHPEITKTFIKIKEKFTKKNINAVFEIPLLIEKKLFFLVDYIVYVYCKDKIQLNRLIKRSNLTKEEAIKIIKKQLPQKEKLKYANFIIDNSYSFKETKEQIKKLMKLIKDSLNN